MTIIPYRAPDYDEPARTRSWVELMAPAVELAKAVAGTEFVPRAFRNNPAPIAAAILYGDEVGLGPMQSLAKIAVIDGRPSLAAEAQRALILAAGHALWLEELTTSRCTWAGKRADQDVTSRVTWTMDDARRAGLAGKPSWRAYPRQMLSARASAELARAMFADVIGGLAATEELEEGDRPAEEQIEPGAVATDSGARPASRRRRRPTRTAAFATTSGAIPSETVELPPLPGEEGTPAMGDAQRRLLMVLMRERGITTQAGRHKYATEVLGRKVTSSADLTADEAAMVIGRLEADQQPEADPAGEPAEAEVVEPTLPLEGE